MLVWLVWGLIGLAFFTHNTAHPTLCRDIKSGNVLISNNLRAKIADFGTLEQARGGVDGGVDVRPRGTMSYMAPECLRGEEQGPKGDVFSFGVLFWEILHEKDPDLLAQENVKVHETQLFQTHEQLVCEDGKRLRFDQGARSHRVSVGGDGGVGMVAFSKVSSHPSHNLNLHADVPGAVRLLGERCMIEQPEERPSFADLIQTLAKLDNRQRVSGL